MAAGLDHLEVLHFLDLAGADLSRPSGKNNTTPLMAATVSWNVRVVEYLLERGVDPDTRDVFGFSAADKARLKNLKRIENLIESYSARKRGQAAVDRSGEAVGAGELGIDRELF